MQNKSFQISKAQMAVLIILSQDKDIKVSINPYTLKSEITTNAEDTPVHLNILLALIKKKLILFDNSDNHIYSTALGLRMSKLGLNPKTAGKSVFAAEPTQKDIKDSLGVKLNGKEIEAEKKKKARQSYNRTLRASYKSA